MFLPPQPETQHPPVYLMVGPLFCGRAGFKVSQQRANPVALLLPRPESAGDGLLPDVESVLGSFVVWL